jgi:hypothetical protein
LIDAHVEPFSKKQKHLVDPWTSGGSWTEFEGELGLAAASLKNKRSSNSCQQWLVELKPESVAFAANT